MDTSKRHFSEDFIKGTKDLIEQCTSKTSLGDVVDNYIQYLEKEYPPLVKPYRNRVKDNPTGARAEAVTFRFFKRHVDDVTVNETQKDGGTDYLCKSGRTEFIVEVTSINTYSLTNKYGVIWDPTKEMSCHYIPTITQKYCNTVFSKHSQMSKYDCP